MTDPIYVESNQSASLRLPNSTVAFLTVREALEHWRNLPLNDREHAVLVLENHDAYQPPEIPLVQLRQGNNLDAPS